MDKKELFDDMTLGQSLNLGDIHPEARGNIEYLLHYCSMGMTPEIYVGVVDDNGFGAVAMSTSIGDAIALKFGLLALIMEVFYATAENISDDIVFYPPLSQAQQIARYVKQRLTVPNTSADRSWRPPMGNRLSPVQRGFAAATITLAVQYVVYHERAHILLGHLGYIHSLRKVKTRLAALDEERQVREEIKGVPVDELKTLELLADYDAIKALFVSLIAIRQTQQPGRGDSVQLIANPKYVYSVFLLALSTTMFIFWLGEGGLERIERTHPHPDVRHTEILHSLIDSIMSIIKEHSAEETRLAREGFQRIEPCSHALRLAIADDAGLYHYLAHNVDRDAKAVEAENSLIQLMRDKTRPYKRP